MTPATCCEHHAALDPEAELLCRRTEAEAFEAAGMELMAERDSALLIALRMTNRAAAAEAKLQAVMRWLEQFESETRATPVNAEDESKGSSIYNWRIWFVRQARSALAGEKGVSA